MNMYFALKLNSYTRLPRPPKVGYRVHTSLFALPHPSPLLGKERGQEGDWAISQPWEELLQYCTEGAE
jgi:hypothetical protein